MTRFCLVRPYRDLGTDRAVARAVACAETIVPSFRPRFAAQVGAHTIPLAAGDRTTARRELIERVPLPAVLLRAVAPNAPRLYECLEEVGSATPTDVVDPATGACVCLAANPRNAFDLKNYARRLAGSLRTAEERAVGAQAVQGYLDRLMVNWAALGRERIAQVLDDARAFLATLPLEPLRRVWAPRISVILEDVARGTRRIIRRQFLPQIGLSLEEPDRVAIDALSRQPGFWVRDAYGRRSQALTAHARRIVGRGLEEGLGREGIARQLVREIPDAWRGHSTAYAETVAANAVSRGRSTSELVTYREAGITQYEIMSVLDENTTHFCVVPSTKITMGDGAYRAISAIMPGDIVRTGSGNPCTVREVIQHTADSILHITLASGRQLLVTSNHPILTARGWVAAGDLMKGETVAAQGTTEGRGVDHATVRALQAPFRGAHHLRRTRADALLLGRVSTRGATQGGRHSHGGVASSAHFWIGSSGDARRIPARELHPVEYLARNQRDTVVDVRRIDYPTPVYNLSISGDPTYIAEGIVVHNCRYMDGRILSVDDAWSHQQRIQRIRDPGDIRTVAPFMRARKNQRTGAMELYAGGTRLATVTRSALREKDDRGQFDAYVASSKQLAQAGVSLPPYHHRCRTGSIPRTVAVQVPRGYAAQAHPIPAREEAHPQPGAQRPPQVYRVPSARRPVSIGVAKAIAPVCDRMRSGAIVCDPVRSGAIRCDRSQWIALNQIKSNKIKEEGISYIQQSRAIEVEKTIDPYAAIDATTADLVAAVSSATRAAGRPLTTVEVARALRATLLALRGPAFAGPVTTARAPLDGLPPTTGARQDRAWRTAVPFAGPAIQALLSSVPLPEIRVLRGAPATYHPARGLLIVPTVVPPAPELVHAAQHVLDHLAGGRAACAVRARFAYAAPLVRTAPREYVLDGPWIDAYDGRVYADPAWMEERYRARDPFTAADHRRAARWQHELLAQMAPRFLPGQEHALALAWTAVPDQVAAFVALQAGRFLGKTHAG